MSACRKVILRKKKNREKKEDLLLRKYVEHAFCMWKQLAGTPVIFLIPQIQETLHN